MHHKLKKDAPSGTADRLLDILKNSRQLTDKQIAHGRNGLVGERPAKEIGSHALRGGDVVGDIPFILLELVSVLNSPIGRLIVRFLLQVLCVLQNG